MDWFTPYNAKALNDADWDYTTAAVLLPNPRIIVMGGKDGNLNVLDPANLGKFNASNNNQIIQQMMVGPSPGSGHLHGGPVYWNGPAGPAIYIWPEHVGLRGYHFSGNRLATVAFTQFSSDTPTHPGGT